MNLIFTNPLANYKQVRHSPLSSVNIAQQTKKLRFCNVAARHVQETVSHFVKGLIIWITCIHEALENRYTSPMSFLSWFYTHCKHCKVYIFPPSYKTGASPEPLFALWSPRDKQWTRTNQLPAWRACRTLSANESILGPPSTNHEHRCKFWPPTEPWRHQRGVTWLDTRGGVKHVV